MTDGTSDDADVPTADDGTGTKLNVADGDRTGIDAQGPIDGPADLEALADRRGVPVRERARSVDADAFALFEDHEGAAVVGITRADGAVLLWEGPRGWTLPFGFVDPEEDWVGAAEGVVAELTGVTFEIADLEALRRVENAREEDGSESVTFHEAIFRAATVPDETATDLSAFESDDDHPDVAWFDGVPENCDHTDDVELFLE